MTYIVTPNSPCIKLCKDCRHFTPIKYSKDGYCGRFMNIDLVSGDVLAVYKASAIREFGCRPEAYYFEPIIVDPPTNDKNNKGQGQGQEPVIDMNALHVFYAVSCCLIVFDILYFAHTFNHLHNLHDLHQHTPPRIQ